MEDEKLSGRVIIDTILSNMRQQVEELRYSKIVPAAYDVYLHPDDQQRFESLANEIAAESVRALQEKLDALNRASRLDRVREIVRKPRLPYKKVGPWLVRIARDPEGAVPRGRALVISQIALTGDSFEGQRTRRLATWSDPAGASPEPREGNLEPVARSLPPRSFERPAADRASSAVLAETRTPDASDTHEIPVRSAFAVLSWEDETGSHRFRMTEIEATIGRAAENSNADVRLATLPDVSRAHARIRYHPENLSFSIEDLSMLGTAVNGTALTRGIPQALPSPAEIRLADAITLRFESRS